MYHKHSTVYLACIGEKSCVCKGCSCGCSPSIIGIKRTYMISAFCLIVIKIILHKERCIFRKRIYHTAGSCIAAISIVFRTLLVYSFSRCFSCFLIVSRIKISVSCHTGHIIHGRCDCCLDSCIYTCSLQCHSTPAADTDNSYTLRVYIVLNREKIYSSLKILHIYIRRMHRTRKSP